MADDVRSYLDAYAKYERAKSKAGLVVKTIKDVSTQLDHYPAVFNFKNTSVGTPPEIGMEHGISADKWPTADQIQQALMEWRGAHAEVEKAWERVSLDDRKGLNRPPSKQLK